MKCKYILISLERYVTSLERRSKVMYYFSSTDDDDDDEKDVDADMA